MKRIFLFSVLLSLLFLTSCTKTQYGPSQSSTIPSGEQTLEFYTQETVDVTITCLPSGTIYTPKVTQVPFSTWPSTRIVIPPGTTQLKLEFFQPCKQTLYTTQLKVYL